VAVGGNFDPALLLAQLEAGPIARLGRAERDSHRGTFNFQAGHQQLVLPRLESARLLMAWPCPAAGALDALMGHELWATLLAEGRRSRLVEELRENLQLVETIDLDIHPLEEGSLAILEATTEPENLPRVIKAVQQVLQGVQGGISAQELDRAKRLLGHGHSFGLEATSQVTHQLAQATLQGRLLDLDAPLHRLENWDLQRLQALAPAWDPAHACILEVLPA
jgi:predicted Zn-dependent peptidase